MVYAYVPTWFNNSVLILHMNFSNMHVLHMQAKELYVEYVLMYKHKMYVKALPIISPTESFFLRIEIKEIYLPI